MGLFNDLGRRVERFKQSAVEAAEAEADYECRSCGARFHTDREECSECRSPEVVPTEEEAGGEPSAVDEAEGEPSAVDEAEGVESAVDEAEGGRPADGEQQGPPAEEQAGSGPPADEPE